MVAILESRPTFDGNTYIVADVDGREVRWEAPGAYADGAALVEAVSGSVDMLLADSYRREYPTAVVTRAAGETERAAWERVVSVGVDDSLDAAGNPAGVPLDQCRESF